MGVVVLVLKFWFGVIMLMHLYAGAKHDMAATFTVGVFAAYFYCWRVILELIDDTDDGGDIIL